MAEKLLPCPFCGGAPKLRVHRSAEDAEECYVECPSCEVRTTYFEDAYAPTDDAAAAWNRRAGHWLPPAEPDRREGYRCIALVELEWAKDISGAFGWHRPDEHAMLMIDADAPGIHGFLPLAAGPAVSPAETDLCPVCAKQLVDDDICASDIEMGICHAACLEGSPTVDLETGDEVDGPMDTYRYGDTAPTKATGGEHAD